MGGTCVNKGCIPKKIFVYAAHYASDFDDCTNFGWRIHSRSLDWPTLIKNKVRTLLLNDNKLVYVLTLFNKNAEIERLNGVYRNILSNAGVKILEGTGKLLDPHTIQV